MTEYKRPTRTIDLPSGKKVEIVDYFSKHEMEELSSMMLAKNKITGKDLTEMKGEGESAFNHMEFDLSVLATADGVAREMAIKKLIDADGKEYEATVESIREFLNEEDGNAVTKAINAMTKKKPTEKK